MRNLKRSLAFLIAIMLVVALMPSFAFAASDYDGHWATGSIERAVQMGWFAQSADNTYRPNASITRAEFVTMVNRMKGFSGDADLSAFSDIKESDWYYGAFAAAVDAGYVQGSGGKLNPTANISRNEAVTIFARISGLDTEADYSAVLANVNDTLNIPDWAKPYAGAAIANGLIAGSNGNFNGTSNITRAETAVLLERLYDNVRTYGFAGTYSGDAASVVISAPGVTLKDSIITGDLTIAASVGDGEVNLSNVKVGGKLDVRGGGKNSLYLDNCEISSIVVTKDEVRVVMSDGTTVTYANVEGSNADIVIGSGATVDNITVEADAVGAAVQIESGATVENVAVAAPNANVSLESGVTVNNLDVSAPNANVSLNSDVTVNNLTVSGENSNVGLASGATVNTMTVAETATGTAIATDSGAKIGTANIAAPNTEVTGAATITTANIKAADVVVESKPTTTNVDSGLTANVGGSDVSGSTTSSGGGGGSGGSSGGSSDSGDYTVYYNVTFDSNGGSAVTQQSVASGSMAASPTVPTRTGYTFVGWFTAPTGGSAYSFASAVTGNVALYARWSVVVGDSGALTTALGATKPGDTISLGASITLTDSATVPAGVTLDIPDTLKLTAGEGGGPDVLTVHGTVTIPALDLLNPDKDKISDFVTVGTPTSSIVVSDTGALKTGGATYIGSGGTLTLGSGATLTLKGNTSLGIPGGAAYTLAGNATVNAHFGVANGDALVIESGKLTITNEALTIGGYLKCEADAIETSGIGKLIIRSIGIYVQTGAANPDQGGGDANFINGVTPAITLTAGAIELTGTTDNYIITLTADPNTPGTPGYATVTAATTGNGFKYTTASLAVQHNNKYVVGAGATLNIDASGRVLVEDDGTLEVESTGTLNAEHLTIVFDESGKLIMNESANFTQPVSTPNFIGNDGADIINLTGTGTKMTITGDLTTGDYGASGPNYTYTLEGSATINSTMPLNYGHTVVIAGTSELTIATVGLLNVSKGNLYISGSSVITFQGGGAINLADDVEVGVSSTGTKFAVDDDSVATTGSTTATATASGGLAITSASGANNSPGGTLRLGEGSYSVSFDDDSEGTITFTTHP